MKIRTETRGAEVRVRQRLVRLQHASQRPLDAVDARTRAQPLPACVTRARRERGREKAASRAPFELELHVVAHSFTSVTSTPITIARKLFHPARITCATCTRKKRT